MNRRTFLGSVGATIALSKLGYAQTPWQQLSEADVIAELTASATPLPVPSSVANVAACSISLNGVWQFLPEPNPKDLPGRAETGWVDVPMPNELFTLGHVLAKDLEYPLRRSVEIPADFTGHRILLRFDGVYSHARVWINGHLVREHSGGFTSWDCDVTDFVQPGSTAHLVLGITDRSDDISQASYYAKHVIAGILRDVRLIAVPQNYLSHLHLNATLDNDYKHGVLEVTALLNAVPASGTELRLKLRNPDKQAVRLESTAIQFNRGTVSSASISVPSPQRWDSEHPNLYTLTIESWTGGKLTSTLNREIGFRKVGRRGNHLLVNGDPVLLRGVCRHSVHPTMGRVVPPGMDEHDAKLLRDGNINFVRTSHYPPSEQFLAACDRHGIYIEEETAVCWSLVEDGPSSSSAFTDRFKSQFQEMITRDHWHPCVIFWSLGNESHWGSNLTEELRFARKHDTSRPLIFSYPDTAALDEQQFDIYSKHYADVDSDLGSSIYPVLHDEFAHVSCYNTSALALDPGIRNFWGESIKRFADGFEATDGCLGGSIWGGIDEVFLFPELITGYGPWGVIDGWRRQKPEYWLTRKAYSPIRILDAAVSHPGTGNELVIPLRNAFDHTDLSEIDVKWQVNNEPAHSIKMRLAPHASGLLRIPRREWNLGDLIKLDFIGPTGRSVDQYALPVEEARRPRFGSPTGVVQITESTTGFKIDGADFSVTISRETGMIANATFKSTSVIEGGPFLDLGAGRTPYWLLKRCDVSKVGDKAVVRVAGEGKHSEGIETVRIEYEMEISGNGMIRLHYRISEKQPTHTNQIGMGFLLSKDCDRIDWHRKSLWSVYPEDHIGRPAGTAMRVASHPVEEYAKAPDWPWSQDMHDFFLQGRKRSANAATNDFRAMKQNVYFASCALAASDARLRVEANGDVAVRAAVETDGRVLLSAFNYWRFPSLEWGNYTGVSGPPAVAEYELLFRLTDEKEPLRPTTSGGLVKAG
jgi:Glycosyl hydrolases family 2, TIM barrel domain/Glycosyl hydrolases family 2, sugar binding domain/Glycosyl hydrolases family 2